MHNCEGHIHAHIHTRVILHLCCRSWAKVDRYGFVNSCLDIRSRAAGTRLYMGHAYMSVVEIARESKSIKQSGGSFRYVMWREPLSGAVRGPTVSFEAKARDFDAQLAPFWHERITGHVGCRRFHVRWSVRHSCQPAAA